MSAPTPRTPVVPHPTDWRRVGPIGVAIAILVGIVVVAFTWTSAASAVRDIPIVVAGPSSATAPVATALGKSDTFDVDTAGSRAAAVRQIEDRAVYGAVVLSADGAPEVLTATAASPAVAQIMSGVATNLQTQAQASADAQAAAAHTTAPKITVTVTDVVPLSKDDPSGSGLVAAAFPLTMGGMLGGIFLGLLVHGTGRRLVGYLAYVVVVGFAIPAVLQGWFGILQGAYLTNVAACMLTIGAIAGTILGAVCLIGRIGISVGPVLFLLFANPLSSAATPVEFLPSPWGVIGQWFPPGAGARLIRDLSYFPGVDSGLQWWILAGWAALGLVLMGVAARVHRVQRALHHGAHAAPAQHVELEADPLTV